ncbi:hypothetical protein FRX31_025848 [Thalictrum thalictroides]|uniref:Uncharacterized protein n=1 Tax=Thalictrum thalictroides TaxID=46969 RepID=A0A7J6VK28_THATH|nr:hypothetical protein FRX31_025848 [Thalictrum thalictroides]
MSTIPRAPKKDFGRTISNKKRKTTDAVIDLEKTTEGSPKVSEIVVPMTHSPTVARSLADNLASDFGHQGSIKSLSFLPLLIGLRLEKDKAKVGERSIEKNRENFSSFIYKGNLIIEKWYSQLSKYNRKNEECRKLREEIHVARQETIKTKANLSLAEDQIVALSDANDEWKVKYEALLVSSEADKKVAIDSIVGWRVEAHEQRARSERRETLIMEEYPDFDCDADKTEIVAEAIASIAEEDRENEEEARR